VPNAPGDPKVNTESNEYHIAVAPWRILAGDLRPLPPLNARGIVTAWLRFCNPFRWLRLAGWTGHKRLV
jgi:hypothetical protein